MKPLGNRLIVIPDEQVMKSKFILTEKEDSNTGIVYEAGDKVEGLKKGDHIIFNGKHVYKYEIDDEQIWIISGDSVYGKID